MANHEFEVANYLTIGVSENKLEAYLEFISVDANFHCTVDQLMGLLQAHTIKHGIQYDKLSSFAENPKEYFYTKLIIAVGDAPRDGKDGEIRFSFDMESKANRPLVQEDGKVDHKEVRHINNVNKGQLIAERTLALEGIPGKAVTGETLFPKMGKEVHFKIGKNIVLDADRMRAYAAIDGLVTKTERDKINVFPVFEVNGDVDYRTGNVDFVGNVVIHGNVITGFKVRAAGDIRVIGGVEGAELEALGSIEITEGILGHHKGSIKAGKDIKCSFIQDANVQARENLIVSQSIMHSNVRAGKDVLCNGTKGLIVGGIVQAGESVVARTIGNSTFTTTTIEVGVLPELRNELTELREQQRSLIDNLDKTSKALNLLGQLEAAGQLTPDKAALRLRLLNTKNQIIDEQSAIKLRVDEIEVSLEDTERARIEVLNAIYGGSKIVIGRYTRFIKDATRRVAFRLVNGEVTMVTP